MNEMMIDLIGSIVRTVEAGVGMDWIAASAMLVTRPARRPSAAPRG
jgi:hypothetical protein